MEIEALRPALRGVAAYKQITDEPLMKLASALLDDLAGGDGPGALEHYTRLFYALHDAGRDGLGAWLHDQLRYRESPYARSVEWEDGDEALAAAAARDITTFAALAELDCGAVLARMKEIAPPEYGAVMDGLPRWQCKAPFTFEELTEFYRTHGSGMFAQYRAFLWEGGELFPVRVPQRDAGL